MNKKYLVRKGIILDSGIETVDESKVVPFNNMRIDGYVDGQKTVIPTYSQTVAIAKNFANAPENTK
ncbi:hypothetical protein [Herbiconiux daphne]|uniref:Uncharacterized protein n=1 Tax=Herbiconiux daphne TaxID=2970914 RepID=A0ABT2H8X3_9MICO|nr:hypothetical protein [Herbiconiux daphne]MCS5736386.1 hypothetical protein [Herbiconiux daphne]